VHLRKEHLSLRFKETGVTVSKQLDKLAKRSRVIAVTGHGGQLIRFLRGTNIIYI
jgi:hypothetical protein